MPAGCRDGDKGVVGGLETSLGMATDWCTSRAADRRLQRGAVPVRPIDQ